jgi:hypothetical protein
MLWKSYVLSSCDCALEQLFCCTVMNLRVMKISVKFYNRYSICTWASLCGKYIILHSIVFEIWLWLGNITANSTNYIMGFGTTFLWNPCLSLCNHVQNFCHEQWEHCCFAVKVFSLAGGGGQMVWKILNTCGFGFILRDPTGICWKADGCCWPKSCTPVCCIVFSWLVFTHASWEKKCYRSIWCLLWG